MDSGFLQKLKDALNYNPDTGEFIWKISKSGNRGIGSIIGTVDFKGYLRVKFENNSYYGHRLAWLYTHGKWPDGVIDHIDGNPLNNRISNLRDVSHSVNSQNQVKRRSDNKSGFLGVSFDMNAGKFRAVIQAGGRSKHLGLFLNPEEAHDAYLAAKRELHEGCTI